jgi:pilus assembly protein CpaE
MTTSTYSENESGCAVFLVSPHPELRAWAFAGVARSPEWQNCPSVDTYPDAGSILQSDPQVVMVDAETDPERALELIHWLVESGIAVVALHTSNNPELILRALRAGAQEFLVLPADADQIVPSLVRLGRRQGPGTRSGRPGKIWTVIPAKPNYGGTTLSCNLAVRLRRLESKRRVLLVDLDPMFGSVGFLLRLKSAFSIADAAMDAEHIDWYYWKKLPVQYRGVDVVLGPDKPGSDGFDPLVAPVLLDFFRKNYAVAVLDSPGPNSSWQTALASHSDEVLLVMTNELAAVHATRKTLCHLDGNGIERTRLKLIVNRYKKENGLSTEAIEKALEMPVFSTLPNDYEAIKKAILEGETIDASCRLGKSLDSLAQRLSGTKPAAARKSWMDDLIGKLGPAKPKKVPQKV